MSNVRVHPYVGSDAYCERCNLPRGNVRHQADEATFTVADLRRWGQEWEEFSGSLRYNMTQYAWVCHRATGELPDEWVDSLWAGLDDDRTITEILADVAAEAELTKDAEVPLYRHRANKDTRKED